MPIPGYAETIATAQVAGPALANFTTAISCLPTPARHTIGADNWYLGKQLKIVAIGAIGNVVTAAPTFTLNFMLGPTSNIIAFTTGAIQASTTAHTAVPFWFEAVLTCRSLGSGTAGTLIGQGRFESRAVVDTSGADVATVGHPELLQPETTPAVGTGFDTNVPNLTDLFVACSAANAANTFQVHQYALIDMGGG